MRFGIRWVYTGLLMFMFLGVGCENPTHENIDRWIRTEKGPDKLRQALANPDVDIELRAHAGQNLVGIDEVSTVLEVLGELPDGDRQIVIAALAPRLWESARISGELTKPSADQVLAKDALFELRALAGEAERVRIDGYLVDWLVGGYYVGRAREGRIPGAAIVRAVGASAAPKLLAAIRNVVDAPVGADGHKLRVERELVLGLAVTGSPDAVGYLLDLMERSDIDPALPKRVLDGLYMAYVDTGDRFARVDGRSLVPHLDRLAARAREQSAPLAERDDLIAIISMAPAPACVDALVPLVRARDRTAMVRWVSANAALRCGGSASLVPVVEGFPTKDEYEASKLAGVLWTPMAALEEHAQVAANARILLQSKSWVARIVGVELLGHLAWAEGAAQDAALVRALVRDRTVLRGWWGDQSALPRAQRKPLPRLGDRATEVAESLEELANPGQKS